MSFNPHSEKQDSVIFSDKLLTIAATGIQWGKSLAGAWWLFRYFQKYPKDKYIVTAPYFKIMNQATLPTFMSVFGSWGIYKAGVAEFHAHTGAIFYFRTGHEADSVVGITDVRAIWGDEAGKYSLYFWENIQGRSALYNCPVCLTTSPYTLNWLYKDIIRPWLKGKLDHPSFLIVSAKSIENPKFSRESYERQKKTMDPRRFRALYDGQFERMQGLVYDCFEEDENIVDPFELPTGTKYYGGIDWGYNDPFVLVVIAITPKGGRFLISETYKSGLLMKHIKKICKLRMKTYEMKLIYCDPSRPDSIEELQEAGIPAVKADNSIMKGIDKVYELLSSRAMKFFRGECKYTQDETEMYHYPEPKDLKPDQDHKEIVPVDIDNHALDALRYVTLGTYHVYKIKIEKDEVPSDTALLEPEQRVARVKRRKHNKRMESFGG